MRLRRRRGLAVDDLHPCLIRFAGSRVNGSPALMVTVAPPHVRPHRTRVDGEAKPWKRNLHGPPESERLRQFKPQSAVAHVNHTDGCAAENCTEVRRRSLTGPASPGATLECAAYRLNELLRAYWLRQKRECSFTVSIARQHGIGVPTDDNGRRRGIHAARADEEIQSIVFAQSDVGDEKIGSKRLDQLRSRGECVGASDVVPDVAKELYRSLQPDRIVIYHYDLAHVVTQERGRWEAVRLHDRERYHPRRRVRCQGRRARDVAAATVD